jgi:hypothetical protein
MFVQLQNFRDYLVNEDGVVVSLKNNKWRELKPTLNIHKYYKINLCVNGVVKTIPIHRLVMLAFVGESSLDINHKNGNKADNTLDNLEYVSHTRNMQHAFETGLINNTGQNNGRSKLSDMQIKELLLLKGTMKQREAAKLFNISTNHVCNIWSAKRHKHLHVNIK